MKRLLFILLLWLPGQNVLAHPQLPSHIYGYWESGEVGIYIYPDGIRVVGLNDLKMDKEEFETWNPLFSRHGGAPLFFKEIQAHNNRLEISINYEYEEKTAFRLTILLEGTLKIKVKLLETSWQAFDKKEIHPAQFSWLFNFHSELSPKLYSPNLHKLEKYEEINRLPEQLFGIWNGRGTNYGFINCIISNYKSYFNIDRIYKNGDVYFILATEWQINSQMLFVVGFEEKHVLLQRFILNHLSFKTFRLDINRLIVMSKLPSSSISLKELDEKFFRKYYLAGDYWAVSNFKQTFQIRKNGSVETRNRTWKLLRMKKYTIPLEDRNFYGDYGIALELYDPGTGQYLTVNSLTKDKKIRYRMFVAGDMFQYDSFGSVLLNFSLVVLGIITFLGALLVIYYRTVVLPRNLKQRLSKIRLEGIKSQLNPHFLFNSMASIQSLMNQEKTSDANRYMAELSDLLRYHLDVGAEDMVLLSEELAALQQYCELENLRSPFSYSFEVDVNIDPENVEIPNQLLQPLLENAIKHGVRYTEDPELLLRVQKVKDKMDIYIIDNGPGILDMNQRQKQTQSLRKTHKGLALIEEKINILQKKGIKLRLDLADRKHDLQEPGTGTRASLEIPLNF